MQSWTCEPQEEESSTITQIMGEIYSPKTTIAPILLQNDKSNNDSEWEFVWHEGWLLGAAKNAPTAIVRIYIQVWQENGLGQERLGTFPSTLQHPQESRVRTGK